jgi:hypothetical protein
MTAINVREMTLEQIEHLGRKLTNPNAAPRVVSARSKL